MNRRTVLAGSRSFQPASAVLNPRNRIVAASGWKSFTPPQLATRLQSGATRRHVATDRSVVLASTHTRQHGPTIVTAPRVNTSDVFGRNDQYATRSFPRLSSVIAQRRWNSTKDDEQLRRDTHSQELPGKELKDAHKDQAAASGFGASSKYILDRIPQLHRPTKEELLAAATGFWHRLQIRFKWFSIRSSRPFNMDDIFAFASWIFWGHILWVVIGTTTFVGVTIWALNTVFTQEQVASWVAGYLTRSLGIQIVFESAIVPRWSDGTIRFHNVFISRRPRNSKNRRSVSKGSSASAAAAAAAEAQLEKDKLKEGRVDEQLPERQDDGNYTQFDLQVDSIEFSLSFTKWFNGKGFLRNVEVRGVRGVIDRTFVQPRVGNEDPFSFRRTHNTGDFELEHCKLEDVLLTVYQPRDFRPYTISIFSGELPRLRKQWLLYDILCANNVSGSFDESLFTIHPRQVHGYTGAPLVEGRDEEASQWKKHSRLRVDGLKIDHLNRGVQGPFGWIYEGNIDIVADFMIPNDADDSVTKVMSDLYERFEASVIKPQTRHVDAEAPKYLNYNDRPGDRTDQQAVEAPSENDKRLLVMDLQIHLNDVRASVPIFNNNLSYVSQAAIRPIVAYINSHSHGTSNFIPISCRIVKRLSDFDGSWTLYDCGLLDDVNREVYTAFANDIHDHKHRNRRIRKVAMWATGVAAQALFIGLAGQLA